ncbi:MAG: alpha/beta fold hydrolase [Neomegalonema sp.]|nr:alpha/beta fold hydrolase [Neomegalonema sp.]
MTPLHFGPSDAPLYGVYHPPQFAPERQPPAVLICPPFGEEAIRAHRFLRILAERLARSGCHVLRFDYTGTGDSVGASETSALSQWREDIALAHTELQDMSGAKRTVWLGLRLGATAAMLASADKPRNLAGLVLWDPVIDGGAFLRESAERHRRDLASAHGMPSDALPPALQTDTDAPEETQTEASGFPIGPQMQRDLASLDLRILTGKPARSALLVGAQPSESAATLLEALQAVKCKAEKLIIPEPQDWNSDKAMNAFVVPRASIEAITARIGDWR